MSRVSFVDVMVDSHGYGYDHYDKIGLWSEFDDRISERRTMRPRGPGRKQAPLRTDTDQKELPVIHRKSLQFKPKRQVEQVQPGPARVEQVDDKPVSEKPSVKFSLAQERRPLPVPIQITMPKAMHHSPVPVRRHDSDSGPARDLEMEMEMFLTDYRRKVQASMRKEAEKDANFLRTNGPRRVDKIPIPKIGQAHPMPSKPPSHSRQYGLLYFNEFMAKGDWSVFWDSSKAGTVPLVLDRSDKYLVFVDRMETQGEKRTMRQWNDMGFVKGNFYKPLLDTAHESWDNNIQHSEVANSLSLIEPVYGDFSNFHKPKLKVRANDEIRIVMDPYVAPVDESGVSVSPYLGDMEAISAKKGCVLLTEHLTEFPPFLLNVGMGSLLVTYWHKETSDDCPPDFDSNWRILEPDEKSPFVAEIRRKEPVPCWSCCLFNIPVWRHSINSNDFLLVRPWKGHNENVFYIRRFDSLWCAGFIEPHETVMRPNTKDSQKFQDSFIKAILLNIFRGTEQYRARSKIRIRQVRKEYFPHVKETKLRKLLKTICHYNRGVWSYKSDPAKLVKDFQDLGVTPEYVCLYESMLAGIWRLNQNGVHLLTGTASSDLCQKIKKLNGEMTKKIATRIEKELMKTPWARTGNFQGSFQSNAMEMEQADDGQQTFKKYARRNKEDGESTVPIKVAGTENDLRKLTNNDLNQLITSEWPKHRGEPMPDIANMARWEKVRIVRELATRMKESDSNTLIKDYARGPRNDFQASRIKFKKQLQQIFDNNLEAIRNTTDMVSGSAADADGEDIFDDITHDMDLEEEEEDIMEPSNAPRRILSSTGDPPQLVPDGICTTPTHIDWDSLGFAGCKMRKVVKLIRIVLTTTSVDVSVEWLRSPNLVEKWSQYPDVCSDPNKIANDFKVAVLKEHKKIISRIHSALSKQKGEYQGPGREIEYQYARFDPSNWIVDETNTDYEFVLRPDVVSRIAEASERFRQLEGRRHERRKNRTDQSQSHAKNRHSADGEKRHKRHTKSSPLQRLNKHFGKIYQLVKERCDLSSQAEDVQRRCSKDVLDYQTIAAFRKDFEPFLSDKGRRIFDAYVTKHEKKLRHIERKIQKLR